MKPEIVQLFIEDALDNYVYILHEPQQNVTFAIDPTRAEPVQQALENKGWKLDYVLNTHHHWDHTDGNIGLQKATGCKVIGYQDDAHRIPGIDIQVQDKQTLQLGNLSAEIMFVPGHTTGHIAYYFADQAMVFPGDTLFCMGCGRMFEGTEEMMWHSLCKLNALPDKTAMYCAHEYTVANGAFALSVEPHNHNTQKRLEEAKDARSKGLSTVPASIGEEKLTNPFLRVESNEIRTTLGMENASDAQIFGALRERKDSF